MNHDQDTCDPERIELSLQQKLSDEEQAAFESHLDDCDDCRRRLEATAAGDDIWSGVRDSFSGQQANCPPSSAPALDSALDPGPGSTTGDDASFNHDTVLELLAPTDDERMLGRLGTYEVVGVVGCGGMGVVLKAFDAALNRYVAIKILAPHLGSSGAARKRFSREAQAAAAVVHDNVIEIHGVADTGGLPYLVMPYVREPSLQRRLDDDGPLALVEILRIAVQAASGLAAAHAQGLVHRDVKPANILLENGVERVKLTDFGLARAADDASLTRTGVIAGTPQYMSPEQARGESVDQRSDLFSLGSVLYAMCTGRAPFRAETSYGVLRRITDEEPRPIREINPDIPGWLCDIIGKLMSKEPDDRYESADDVAQLLEQCLAHVQQPTAVPLPDSLEAQTGGKRFFSISPRSIKGIAMIAVLGSSLLGLFLWHGAEAPPTELKVQTTPPGATVFLDGKELGKAPNTFDVKQGKHELLAVLEGHRAARRDIVVPATRVEPVSLTLQRIVSSADMYNGSRGEAKKRQTEIEVPLPVLKRLAQMADVPPGWKVVEQSDVPTDQRTEIGKRLGGRIEKLTNDVYLAHGVRIQVNVMKCATTEDAANVHASVLKMKGDPAYCLLMNKIVVELVGQFDVDFAKRAARELLGEGPYVPDSSRPAVSPTVAQRDRYRALAEALLARKKLLQTAIEIYHSDYGKYPALREGWAELTRPDGDKGPFIDGEPANPFTGDSTVAHDDSADWQYDPKTHEFRAVVPFGKEKAESLGLTSKDVVTKDDTKATLPDVDRSDVKTSLEGAAPPTKVRVPDGLGTTAPAEGHPRHKLLGTWYGQFVDGSYLPSDVWCVWEFREDGKSAYTRGRYGPDGRIDLAQRGEEEVIGYKIDDQGRLVLFMPGENTKYCPFEVRNGTVYISVDHENDFVFTRAQRPSQYIKPRKAARIDRAVKRYEHSFRILTHRWLERNREADGRQPVDLADLAGDEPERTLSPLGPTRIVPEGYADWDKKKREAWLRDHAGLVYLPVPTPADDEDEQLQNGSLPPGHVLLFERPTANRNELFVVRVDERGRIAPRPESISAGQLDQLIKKQTGKELDAWSFDNHEAAQADLSVERTSSRSVLSVAPREPFSPQLEAELLSELNAQLPFEIQRKDFIAKEKSGTLVGWAVVGTGDQKEIAKTKVDESTTLRLLQVEALTPEFEAIMKQHKR